MHLYLVGYRGTGKTTVARELGQRLNLPVFDSDEVIEQREGSTIRAIFEKHGETGFRDREVAAIEFLSTQTASVLALGGGAVLRPRNRQVIRQSGRCVWLQAPPELIAQRIAGDPSTAERRPTLTNRGGYDEIVTLLAQREPMYREVSEKTVQTADRSPDEIALEIAQWFQQTRPAQTTG